MAALPDATLNASLTTAEREVWKVEALPCHSGETFRLTFEDSADRWRQGVWVATDGTLRANGEEAAQFVFWQDTAPPSVRLEVLATDGLLRLYNVWDSGRGRSRESQSATSGMLREAVKDGYRYRCNDIGNDPSFTSLTFLLVRE